MGKRKNTAVKQQKSCISTFSDPDTEPHLSRLLVSHNHSNHLDLPTIEDLLRSIINNLDPRVEVVVL